MKKSETLSVLVPLLDSTLAPLSYKYLKSREKFTCQCDSGKKWLGMNVTYWASSDYCMFSPILGVHFDGLEQFKAEHIGGKPDPHMPSLHLLSDNLKDGGFWSFTSKDDVEAHAPEIESKLTTLYVPYLDAMADRRNALSMVLDRTFDNFMNEYDRLVFLFSFVGAYGATDITERILASFDPSLKSLNQQIPYHKQQLSLLKAGVPEIGMIDIDQV